MTDTQEQKDDMAKIAKLIKDIDFGMLTTTDDDGTLRSRPMSANGKVEFDGDIWFFTYGDSHKVLEAQKHPQVNVSFSDIKNHKYVSVSGTAKLVRDKAKIEELWEPILKAWFPEGVDTPDIALLQISATKAEYWDSPSSFIAKTIELLRAATGQPLDIGENKKVAISK
ncbi:MAG TPA: pyridoxamine 5'-phosphate oxidase family protein [Drouetiella sp.]